MATTDKHQAKTLRMIRMKDLLIQGYNRKGQRMSIQRNFSGQSIPTHQNHGLLWISRNVASGKGKTSYKDSLYNMLSPKVLLISSKCHFLAILSCYPKQKWLLLGICLEQTSQDFFLDRQASLCNSKMESISNLDHIVSSKTCILQIYKLLLRFETEYGQITNCMVTWATNFSYNINMGRWEKLWETGVTFTFCHNLKENFRKWCISGI